MSGLLSSSRKKVSSPQRQRDPGLTCSVKRARRKAWDADFALDGRREAPLLHARVDAAAYKGHSGRGHGRTRVLEYYRIAGNCLVPYRL